ncbi:unnamed protein product, partial [Heterosigma akashiwo]
MITGSGSTRAPSRASTTTPRVRALTTPPSRHAQQPHAAAEPGRQVARERAAAAGAADGAGGGRRRGLGGAGRHRRQARPHHRHRVRGPRHHPAGHGAVADALAPPDGDRQGVRDGPAAAADHHAPADLRGAVLRHRAQPHRHGAGAGPGRVLVRGPLRPERAEYQHGRRRGGPEDGRHGGREDRARDRGRGGARLRPRGHALGRPALPERALQAADHQGRRVCEHDDAHVLPAADGRGGLHHGRDQRGGADADAGGGEEVAAGPRAAAAVLGGPGRARGEGGARGDGQRGRHAGGQHSEGPGGGGADQPHLTSRTPPCSPSRAPASAAASAWARVPIALQLTPTKSSDFEIVSNTDTVITLKLKPGKKWAGVGHDKTTQLKIKAIDSGAGEEQFKPPIEIAEVHSDLDDDEKGQCDDTCAGHCGRECGRGRPHLLRQLVQRDVWRLEAAITTPATTASSYTSDSRVRVTDSAWPRVAGLLHPERPGPCDPGTDCTDCGGLRAGDSAPECENTCMFARDGYCDDPRGNDLCKAGSDCQDCGPRSASNFTDHWDTQWFDEDDDFFYDYEEGLSWWDQPTARPAAVDAAA